LRGKQLRGEHYRLGQLTPLQKNGNAPKTKKKATTGGERATTGGERTRREPY
jgi:hypothetical protein